jgi:photosystem II stability/assembly factor-like uncharacterized protein
MNEDAIRKRLRSALGESIYPPEFTSQLAARLAEPVHSERRTWALAVVATLLALAIVLTLVLGVRSLRPRADLPTQPPPPVAQLPGGSVCLRDPGQIDLGDLGGPDSVHLVKMASTTTGWAWGSLRTTDGGAHWRDVSPPPSPLREDASPYAKTKPPPGYSAFYLDANHAWEARIYASTASCYDRIATFHTVDGGRTWEPSQTVALQVKAGWSAYSSLFFVGPTNGWLWVTRRDMSMYPTRGDAAMTEGDLYQTADGGLHWRLVSTLVSSKLGIPASDSCQLGRDLTFASLNTGWITLCQRSEAELLMTNDGGVTWKIQKLPAPAGPGICPCSTEVPRFIDKSHGIARVHGSHGFAYAPSDTGLFATSDGGQTWRQFPQPGAGYLLLVDFVDPTNLWALVTPPGWNKIDRIAGFELYRTSNGGGTWTLVRRDVPAAWPPGYMHFVDAKHGFEQDFNGRALLVTSDGGLTWKSINAAI